MTWQSILAAIVATLGVIRDFFAWKKTTNDRQAGADAANASTQAQNDARVKEAMEAEIEAGKAHQTLPGDEAFDTEFRRD